jgi:hypothetical protein
MIFVGAGEPNKFAIYGIPGHKILGDYAGLDPSGTNNTLPAWPVCALPQRPGALTVVPRLTGGTTPTPTAADGGADAGAGEAGAADSGADAGAAPSAPAPTVAIDYDLVVVLPGDRTSSGKVVTIDPKPFLRAVPRLGANGQPAEDFGAGPVLAPGALEPCQFTGVIPLVGSQAIPPSVDAGVPWPDGVVYVDGGVDLTCQQPSVLPPCGLRPCTDREGNACQPPDVPVEAGAEDAGAVDGGSPDAGSGDAAAAQACDPNPPPSSTPPITFAFPPLDPPQPLAIAREDQFLFVADDALPLIHLIDLTNPAAPQELAPFIVSSIAEPSRVVAVKDIAISPPTRDFKRYLYAVDHRQGTLAVFDVTDPRNADRSPLLRPHPELNPFAPPDRITFSSPVVAVAFAQHDFPLTRQNGVPLPNGQALTGLLCNPSPNLSPTINGEPDPGVYYRADSTDPISPNPLGPYRLRGIFGFATLSSGQVVVLDVDDWDAPCRRPQLLEGPPTVTATSAAPNDVGVLAAAQPNPDPPTTDTNPYHAPNAPPEGVTQEIFFPVSAPHRLRSQFYLRDDPTTGKHIPYLAAVPTIQSIGAPLPLAGEGSEATPHLRPTAVVPGVATGTEDIGLRFSIDDPEVQIDQDWTVTYEGSLPGFDGFSATMDTPDNYSSLVLSQPEVHFCAKGVEDWTIGGERATAITSALAASERQGYPERLDRRMTDYVELTEDLLDPSDAYWQLPGDPLGCWDPSTSTAADRYNACLSEFGGAGDQGGTRNLPILEAYDDHVVVGTFSVIPPNKTREVVYKDPFNAPTLKRVRCCFHNQARFHVRTGSEWVAVGSAVGFLNHMQQGDGGRCVPSCETRETLLNGRLPSLPYGGPTDFAPFRDSALALRNPTFAFFVQNGNRNGADVVPSRDTSWTFSTRGQYTPLLVNIAATTTLVDPQSMRFLAPIGQIAVVDAETQGLVLIDLSTVALARAPFF